MGDVRLRQVGSLQRLGLVIAGALAGVALSGTPAPALPDNRAWELVSPPNKHSGVIEPLQTFTSAKGALVQAAADGSAISYLSDQSLFAEPEGEPDLSQALSTRGESGWSPRDIATPSQSPGDEPISSGEEYRFFSPDLSLALVEPFGYAPWVPLSPEATERTAYVRNNENNKYRPLLTPADVPPGTKFGGEPDRRASFVHFAGATPDLSHILLRTEGVALTETPVNGGGLYEWSAGRLQLVSVLPESGGEVDGLLGHEGIDARHAISADGSRVFWENVGSPRHLYVHDAALGENGETLQIDAVQPGASGEGEIGPMFQSASSDGTRVFFTDAQKLTKDSGAAEERPDLYECIVAVKDGKLVCEVRDITPAIAGESAEVQSVVPGVSDDGSYVYLVAKGVLTSSPNERSEKAIAGADNLYVLHEQGGTWTTTFIASLSEEDGPDWAALEAGAVRSVTARVSPNGHYFAFMSDRSLTGYDNVDVNSGRPDEEVYMYDASAPRPPRLVCASCNPTGARPIGVLDPPQPGLLVDPGGMPAWTGRWLAAVVPEWTGIDSTEALYQSRYLGNDGRLFFDSSDVLVPQATNGMMDVYEYEPAGVPEGEAACKESVATFNPSTGGCVDLISSGTSGQESAFLDASESGGDVFFLTAARLTTKDTDNQFDVYDAHECTQASPCIAPTPGSPPSPCTTVEACRPSSPAREAGSLAPGVPPPGSGNLPSSEGALGTHRSKPSARARLAAALRACARKPKNKRAKCRAAAIRRYGSLTHAKPSRRKPARRRGHRA